jgi:ABC-type transport system involved in multi-copper enzyme maturation permease subunit
LLIKAAVSSGAPYAAVMVTPGHGVRMQANFNTDLAGPADSSPRWLKLTRAGDFVTGYVSADGLSWQEVGRVTVQLPHDAEVGLFVGSTPSYVTQRTGGGTSITVRGTIGTATFDSVTVNGTRPTRQWTGQNIDEVPMKSALGVSPPGGMSRSGDTFAITGTGDISGYGIASWRSPGDDDVVVNSLFGVRVGMIAVIALGVLFVTAEYRTGLIRTTLAAGPRRGQVLAAKAVVLGGVVFVTGLITSVASFLIAQPGLHAGGYNPPAYPHVSLLDGVTLRAVFGTAIFLTLVSLFSLGIAVLRRRTVGAIVFVIALVVVPQIVAPAISLEADMWVSRITPVAGLAVQQSIDRAGQVIGPWAGISVVCAWVVAALGLAYWQFSRRDA